MNDLPMHPMPECLRCSTSTGRTRLLSAALKALAIPARPGPARPGPARQRGTPPCFHASRSHLGQSRHFARAPLTSGLPRLADIPRVSRHVRKVPIPEVTGESATSGQARDDHAASLLTLDLIRAADDAPSSDSPYPTSRTMRSFNG